MLQKLNKVLSTAAALSLILGQPIWAQKKLTLNGAGATFPYPIYSKWFDEYHKKTGVQINYQSIGSGGGIKQITSKTVDFGATDGPMNDKRLLAVDGKLLHIPTVLGAVVPIYHIPGFSGELKFSGTTLADIFLGKIKKWNDPALTALNPEAKLPDAAIIVVHRSDGAGTTYCWVDYLCAVSPEWKSTVGKGTAVRWPVGLGGKGNEGVSGTVKQTPNSIGYVELIYAKQNNIAYGSVRNKAGKFVKASEESVTAAAASAKMPADYRVSIVDAPGENSYPISTFTWLLVYQNMGGEKGRILKDFLNWMVTDGQDIAPALGYAALPDNVASMVKQTIQTLK